MFSVSDLKRHLTYDPESGSLFWHDPTCRRIKRGALAGSLGNKGYWRLNFKGRTLAAHRVAWAIHYGVWPDGQIDHINRNPVDNRIKNLRVVTGSENCLNRQHRRPGAIRHGGRGVTKTRRGKWQVQVHDPNLGRARYYGIFPTEKEALHVASMVRREMDL